MRKFFLGFIALLVSATMLAAPRSIEEAAEIAAQFVNAQPQQSRLNKAPHKAAAMHFAHKVTKPNSAEDAFFIFNQSDNSGFVIVSADDNAVTILGYSDEGVFDAANIPANVQFWLNFVAERVADAKPAADNRAKKARKALQASAISPLLGNIKWNQGTPYNNMCPMDKTTRAYTGCVATAAAQIMKMYNWPETGQGSHTDNWTSDAGKQGTSFANFGATTYDWANMLDTYKNNNYTTAQANAVATLMFHVGVACDMQYGGDESNGSGAYTDDMGNALVTYFRYKNTAQYKSNQSTSQLTSLFNTELEAGRPILMGGCNDNAGHEFVCDGRDADGLFHINWGWGGTSNGYFALNGLDPDQQGPGGSAAGYNQQIDCVIGIEPDRDPINVTSVTVTPNTLSLKIKENSQLTATISPADASNKGLEWTSSDENVATVSASGVVKGIAPGSATITATSLDGNKTATCTVTVTDEVALPTLLEVNRASAKYDSQYEEPWTIAVYKNNSELVPYISFWPDGKQTTKIAGTYTFTGSGGYLWNNMNDPDESIKITTGQLVITCVGVDNGTNGCNTYRILSYFTCEDNSEYKVDATLEICAKDANNNAIDLTDAVSALPYEVTWMANGVTFAENIAFNNKLTLPADKPGNCPNGKVFVGWSEDEIAGTDEAPAFAKNGDAVTANTTYHAVYATVEDEGGGSTNTTLTMEDYAAPSGTFNGFEFTAGGSGTAAAYNANGKDARYYANNTLTISSAVEMTQIVFNISAQGLKRLAPITVNTGSIATQKSGDTKVTWTGSATSVTFTVGAQANYGSDGSSKAGQLDFTSVDITTGGGTYSGYSTTCDGPAPEPVYYSIRFFSNGEQIGATQSVLKGQQAEVPANPSADCADYTFAGWWTAELAADNTEAKTWITNFKATKNQDYYAVYSKTISGEPVLSNNYAKISNLADLTTGNYVVAGNGTKAMKAEVYNNYYLATTTVSPSSNIISNPAANIVWQITRTNNQVSFYNESTNKYAYFYKSGNYYDLGLRANSYLFNVSMNNSSSCTFEASDYSGQYMVYLIYQTNTHEFAAKNTSSTSIYLYKQQTEDGSTTYYSTTLTCTPSAIETIENDCKAVKVMENGQIVIIRGNEKYTIFGQKIK